MNVVIHPCLNIFTIEDFVIRYNRESRRISCMMADSDNMNQIMVCNAQNKTNPTDAFLISLYFAEELATIKSNFHGQFDKQIKHFITEFAISVRNPKGYRLTEDI